MVRALSPRGRRFRDRRHDLDAAGARRGGRALDARRDAVRFRRGGGVLEGRRRGLKQADAGPRQKRKVPL